MKYARLLAGLCVHGHPGESPNCSNVQNGFVSGIPLEPSGTIGALLSLVFIVLIVWAIINSKKETIEMQEVDNELSGGKS